MKNSWPIKTPLLWSIVVGASFGLLMRVAIAFDPFTYRTVGGLTLTGLMSISYIALGSAGVGYVTIWCAEAKGNRPIWQWIVVPWCAVLLMMLGAAVFLLEGAICLAFALPMLMLFASIGGHVGWCD